MSSLTAYATGDFYCMHTSPGYNGSDETVWDGVRHASSGTCSTNQTLIVKAWLNSNYENISISRSFLSFNTVDIPDADTVSSALLKLYCTLSVTGSGDVVTVEGTQHDTAHGDLYDYDNFNTTELSDVLTPSSTSWTTFTINSSGLSLINKTGYTKLCLIQHSADLHDVYANAPLSATDQRFVFNSSTGTYPPYLEITYGSAVVSHRPFAGRGI
jgi:hypothetical protein